MSESSDIYGIILRHCDIFFFFKLKLRLYIGLDLFTELVWSNYPQKYIDLIMHILFYSSSKVGK